MATPSIGWFGEDVIDWAGEALSDGADVFVDIAEEIPMAPELAGALKDVVNGPLRDFARTDLGMTVFRAMSSTIYGPLAWTIGPQVAALAFAVPGLARGQDFWTAWLSELKWRAEETVEILAPGAADAMTPQIKAAAEKLAALLPYEDLRDVALSELAARLNVSEWTAAMAASAIGLIPVPSRGAFDALSGRREGGGGVPLSQASTGGPTLSLRRRPGAPSSGPRLNVCQAADAAEKAGQARAIVTALRQKCYAAQDAGEIDRFGYTVPSSMRVSAVEPSPRNGPGSTVALVALVAAAAGALVWWSRSA